MAPLLNIWDTLILISRLSTYESPYQYEGDGTGEQNSVGLLTV